MLSLVFCLDSEMEKLWLEFVPDLSTLRVYSREGDIRVHTTADRLKFTSNSHEIEFPILKNSSPYISAPESSDNLTILSVKLDGISSEDVDNFFCPSSALFEDWSKVEGKLLCRSCQYPIDVLDLSELTPCLLPSATWGFEDMRVCEECGPLVVGDMRSHRHEKKSRRKNLFIDKDKIFCECGIDVRCQKCDVIVGNTQLSAGSIERLKVVNKSEGMVEFEKSKLDGPKFLTSYTDRSDEIDSIVRYIEDENESRTLPVFLQSKLFRILSRRSNEVIVISASKRTPVWGVRLMYHDDSLGHFDENFQNQLQHFAVPSALKKNWFSTIIAPISPQILEL